MEMDIEDRFWGRVNLKGPNQCWPWMGGQSDGYGTFYLNGRTIGAHRVAFELFYNKKPKKWILHKCDNRICVNPLHLYEGDRIANSMDYVERGNTIAARARQEDPSWKRGRILPWEKGKRKRRVSIRTRLKLERKEVKHLARGNQPTINPKERNNKDETAHNRSCCPTA